MNEATKIARNRKPLPLACLVISMGLLIVGLWPFRFFPGNNIHWIDGRPGLRFETYGIVSSNGPFFVPGGANDLAKSFNILPREEPSGSIPRILSAYNAGWRELFFLGQWRDELILRILREEQFYRLRYRETLAVGLQKGVKRSIVVRSGTDGLTLFVDGIPTRRIPASISLSCRTSRGRRG